MTARGHWFGPAGRPLLGWLSADEATARSSGVVILPPVGYQYWSSYRTLRVLAERLAGDGHVVLRVDYDGTGDSAGDQWDGERLAGWRRSAVLAARELAALGCETVSLVGVRLGGTIALLEAAGLGARSVVAWAPATSGRRHLRETRLLSAPVPEGRAPRGQEGAMVAAGTVFTSPTQDALAGLDLTSLDERPAARVLVVEGDAGASRRTVQRLRELGAVVDHELLAGGELALEEPAEYATVPDAIVEAVRSWIGPAAGGRVEVGAARAATRLEWDGAAIEEEVVALGDAGLIGVLSRPSGGAGDRPIAVFVNSGSEPHIGPGRAWVEYARGLAASGWPALRVDFSGWGESPDRGHAPGRPYDAHCERELLEIAAALRPLGHERVVPVGLCAGAWVALRAALRAPPAGVVALNPQLYWVPGDPVEATMAETRARRARERAREARGARWGWWTLLDLAGRRPWAGRWLDDLRATGVPILLLFAEGDDGLEYLRARMGRRLRRATRANVRVEEVAEIDHSMHRTWLRGRILEAVRGQLERVAAEAELSDG